MAHQVAQEVAYQVTQSNGPVVAQSDLCQRGQTERAVLTPTMGGVVGGVGNTAESVVVQLAPSRGI